VWIFCGRILCEEDGYFFSLVWFPSELENTVRVGRETMIISQHVQGEAMFTFGDCIVCPHVFSPLIIFFPVLRVANRTDREAISLCCSFPLIIGNTYEFNLSVWAFDTYTGHILAISTDID
jgi:hypothetical protein